LLAKRGDVEIKMAYSSPEHLREIFDLFIFRLFGDVTSVRYSADSPSLSVSLFGCVFVNDDRDLVWIAPTLESAQKAKAGVRFRFRDVVSSSHKEVTEASPDEIAALSTQMELL
jgi:hypothetical protein